METKQLKVDPIKNGTVIDHITAGKALQVAEILNISNCDSEVMIGLNLSSNKMPKKDLIKIENRELSKEEVGSIALISPNATLIYIKDFQVISKNTIEIPQKIKKLVVCPNPNCVTNIEQVNTHFELAGINPVEIRCVYCEKKYKIDKVQFKF